MATLSDTASQIGLREQQISSQREQIQKYEQAIPKTTAQQLRGQIGRGQTINPLKALQKRRTYSQARKKVEQAKQNIQQYEKEIVQYKQQLEQYKQTQAGRLQYAKEYGIKPKTITGKLGKGYVTQVLGYEYETPYGKVTDWSPKEKQLQTEAKLVSTYTPEQSSQYFAPEIEKGLTKSGLTFQRDDSGQLIIQDVPTAKKGISFSTIFGNQSMQFKPTSMQEKVQLNKDYVPVRTIIKEEVTPTFTEVKKSSVWGGEMFPMVSAQESSNKSLNMSSPSTSYDTNVSTGNNLLGNSVSRIRNWVSTNIIGSTKDFDEAKEIYSPELKAFVSASEPSGQATGILGQPTQEQALAIERASYLGSYEGIKDTATEFATRQLDKMQQIPTIKKVRESSFISSLKDYKVENNSWINRINKPLTKEQRGFYSPEKIKEAFDWGAEQTLRAGEYLGTQLIKRGIVTDETLIGPSPIKRETAKELISGAYMFASLEPFMRTGTAQTQESEFVYDAKQKKFIKKSDLEKYLSSPEVSGKTYKYDLSYSTKAERINVLLKNLKNRNDPTAVKKILEIAKESYGKEFVKDFAAQELGLITLVKATPKVSAKIDKVESLFSGSTGVELKGMYKIESATQQAQIYSESKYSGTGQYERTDSFQIPRTAQDSLSSQKMFQGLGSLSISRQQTNQITKQQQNQFQYPLTKNITRTDLKPRQDTFSKTRQDIKQISRTRTVDTLVIKPRVEVRPGTPQPQKPKQPDPLKIRLPYFTGKPKKRKIIGKQFRPGEEFLAITKRKGKEVIVGRAKTARQAAQIARLSALGTLGVTAKVKTKAGKQIALRPDKLFRRSKTDPLAIVQRKTVGSGRLASKGEKLEIKLAKRGGSAFKIL